MPEEDNLEVEEDNSVEEVGEPESIEEPSEEVVSEDETQEEDNLILGKFKSQEDLVSAYKNLESKLGERQEPRTETKTVDPQSQEVIDQLRKYGVVLKDDLEQKLGQMTQAQKDDFEIKQLNLTSKQEQILRAVAGQKDNWNRSMTEVWNEDIVPLVGGGKIVSKKTTIKPKAGKKTSDFKELTTAQLSKLSEKEYQEYWKKLAEVRQNA